MSVFLDTSVLVGGLIDFGPQSAPAHSLLHAVAEKTVAPAATAWHCCLEFYSVSTRLPVEYRLAPTDATRLVEEERELSSTICHRAFGCRSFAPRPTTRSAAAGSMTRTSRRSRAR